MDNRKLPLLPGFSVQKDSDQHNLPHKFEYLNGTNILIDKNVNENNCSCNLPKVPSIEAKDKTILCFKAFFRENDGCDSNSPMQKNYSVKIKFYMEDDTVEIIYDPNLHSSGTLKSFIVQRQKIPCPEWRNEKYLTLNDFNVCKKVSVFGVIYNIVDCDSPTRKHLCLLGIDVPRPIEMPNCQNRPSVSSPKKRIETTVTKLEKFLKFDNLRLKFNAYWDDRVNSTGNLHELIVYYYLIDDTVKIIDTTESGKPTILLRRQKLPKDTKDAIQSGKLVNIGVLNYSGKKKCDNYVKDKQMPEVSNINSYNTIDFTIGAHINVFGRTIVIIDCDDFTREYYRSRYGIQNFTSLPKPDPPQIINESPKKELPPHNGWGSYEDSEQNCKSFEAKRPKSNMKKFLSMGNIKLRFKARLLSDINENCDRIFIITYYLCDDTISVFQLTSHGFPPHEFLKRDKYYLPITDRYSCDPPIQYKPQSIYIGATIQLRDFEFFIVESDLFTMTFMESHPNDFPLSNINRIMDKIRTAIKPVYTKFIGKYLNGKITGDTICICCKTTRSALKELLRDQITEHEIVTFLRHFSYDKSEDTSKQVDRNMLQSIIQMQLERHLFDDIDGVKNRLYEIDPINCNGFISPAKLRCVIKGCRMPISDEIIVDMFEVLKKNSSGNIDTTDFLYFIDAKKSLAPRIQPQAYDEQCKIMSKPSTGLINWTAFLDELAIESETSN